MAWSNSKIFVPFLVEALKNTQAFDLDGDTFKAALYNNSITPDNDVAIASSAYNTGQWATAQEVYQVGQWAQAGVGLASPAMNPGSPPADTVSWDANDTASGSSCTIANAYGCLVYDDTVSDYGISYNYFGGAQGVTSGTFTLVWHANGIWRITL